LSGAARLNLDLRPSRALAAWIVVAHVAAAGCVLLVFPLPAGAVLAVLLGGLGLAVAWRVALLGAAGSPVGLALGDDGALEVRLRSGAGIALQVSAPRHVTRYWVLVANLPRPVRHLLVTADMLPAAEFRRLRVWALWGGVAATAPVAYPPRAGNPGRQN